jgi:PTS system mannose-specific IID component
MSRTNKKLSQEALKKAAIRHNCTLEWCWNYERMQATGFAYGMVPILKELYDTDEEVCRNLERHMQFYNCHPGASSVIFGASAALEEEYQPDMSDSMKVALMGPMAGIGDTIQAVLVKPIAFIIAASMASEGSFLSLLVMILPFVALWYVRFPLFKFGYNRSVSVIQDINGDSTLNRFKEAAQIVGLTVIGGFVPSMIEVVLPLTYEKTLNGVTETVAIQDTLDGILPYLLPILIVWFCYWMLHNKKIKPVQAIGIITVIAFVCGALGILGV